MDSRAMTWQDVDDGAGYPAQVMNAIHSTIEAHSHDFYEIVYVLDGFCLHGVNGSMSLLMAGDIVALRPGDVHGYRGQRNVSIYNLLFLPRALDGLMDDVLALPGMAEFFSGRPSLPLQLHLSLPDRRYMQTILSELAAERRDRLAGWDLRCKGLLADFIVRFARIFGGRYACRQESPYLGYVSSALAYIDDHYSQPISIAQLAGQLGICPDHLTRQFKQVMGITPIEYLRRYRFARALELLSAHQPVSRVSDAVGFRHLSHFSREFKSVFDMTPSEYQKQSRQQ